MKIKFSKMQGAGNDFVVIDSTKEQFSLSPENIRFLADRHFGVGADQVLVIEKTELPDVDFKYRIFNHDGGEVEQCGNGARCFARYVHNKGLTNKKKIKVETVKEIIEPELLDDGSVRVMMNTPSFRPSDLPFNPKGLPEREINGEKQWAVSFQGKLWWFSISSIGNPHVTIQVENLDETPIKGLGSFIENHPAFPARVNVGFLQIQDPHHGKFAVWERGAGQTLACGTGNCAAAATAIKNEAMESPVALENLGGTLTLEWEGEGMNIYLRGPAEMVFDSEIEI